MLYAILLPLLAVAGGLGGFFLRRWELAAAFEHTGLAIPGSVPSICLMILSAVLTLLLAFLCARRQYRPTHYTAAFAAPGNWACLVGSALASACLLLSGAAILRKAPASESRLLLLLLGVLCVASFFCVLCTALRNFRGTRSQYSLPLLVPAYTCCLWLVTSYQQRALNPTVLSYVYELLAIVCLVLAFYFTAGFSFGRTLVWPCAFFALLGIYFGLVTLADSHSLSIRLLLLSCILQQLINVCALLHHAFTGKQTTVSDETNNTQEVTPDE